MVARELTKRHQEFLRGTTSTIIGQITVVVGEFTVVLGPRVAAETPSILVNDRDIWVEFGRTTARDARSRRGVVAELAHKYGRSTNDVYAILERMKDGR
jgi:16S rRNA C1402 (ribose-2'-O) methylase RsmI